MSGGYCYGEPEPKERCPYCGALCCADFVDIGIGNIQCGPFHCEACGASEMGPHGNGRERTSDEIKTGWYGPDSPPDLSANVDDAGRIVRHFEADTLYRQKLGVAPRYDRYGRLL